MFAFALALSLSGLAGFILFLITDAATSAESEKLSLNKASIICAVVAAIGFALMTVIQ